ncbi:uncharacterized protein RAG0_08522 [Rhynchosporium agropyri]|uniref:non-specific serine/threonine protein kinase n=1 Tax=Rhynchosporium agropyri TaxID=914238 RepID=A0A1E1KR76_9HELO|nr:uncharacterized protein RAG0_08522 [Rhynchosporium agropyri]
MANIPGPVPPPPPGVAGPFATPAFLTANPTFIEQYRGWYGYNNPGSIPAGTIPLPAAFIPSWRAANFVRAPLPLDFVAPLLGPTIPTAIVFPPAPPLPFEIPAAAQLAFLNPPFAPRGIGKRPANWRGNKVLGFGGQGTVCLWEWSPKATARPTIDQLQVAVKIATPTGVGDLGLEAATMMAHRKIESDHIARLLAPPKILTRADCVREGLLPGVWQGRINRLMMEYYPHGSLDGLRRRRRARNFPFEELTLWRIFECLVDGCSVLTYDQELKMSSVGNVLVPAVQVPPLRTTVHFDLKPHNIFAAISNKEHDGIPVYKIGDFGGILKVDSNPLNVKARNVWRVDNAMRLQGTRGYYAPEQFTPRWDSKDFRTSPVCGKYGTATNVWGIGVIMYQVCIPFSYLHNSQAKADAIYTSAPPRPHRPFSYTSATTGETFVSYGQFLARQNYSGTIKDLIAECLAEIPGQRPGLIELKTRIRDNIALLKANGATSDKWYDMELPDPESVRAEATDIALAAGPIAPPPAGNRRAPFRKANLKATRGWPY